MDNLPIETLIKIFSLLETNSKLKCILICKKWYIIITENILYKRLEFKNSDNFNDAMELFFNKKQFGLFVEELIIKEWIIDIFSIFSIPLQLPNVMILNWSEASRTFEERKEKDIFPKELPTNKVYQRILKNWNKIVRLTINIERLSFATMLLESSTLTHLTYLNVNLYPLLIDGYFYQPSMIKISYIIKELIKNIKNAPSLEQIVLNCPVLDLDDMDNLHASSPKLKSIDLAYTAIKADQNISSSIGQISANNVKTLHIDFFLQIAQTNDHNVTGVLKEVMLKWLIYIGYKYNNINDMILKGLKQNYLPEISEFEQPILTIINKMQSLTSYHAFIYPITRSVMDAIDNNNGNLKQLYIYTNVLNKIETQLDYVNSSRQSKTIFYLKICCEGLDIAVSPTFTKIIIGLSLHFQCLTDLTITSNIHHSALVEIVQRLSTLTNLQLNIYFNSQEGIDIVPIKKCKINTLHITLCWDKVGDIIHKANQAMEFILQSCPLLSKFTLNGDLVSCSNGINLSFFIHENLKNIHIDIKGVQYYTFPWLDDKQGIKWVDYTEPLKSKDKMAEDLHVNISWRDNQNFKILLKKAPVKAE